MHPQLTWNWLYRPGQSQTHSSLPAVASCMLEIKGAATILYQGTIILKLFLLSF